MRKAYHYELRDHNTFGIEAHCKCFVEYTNIEEAQTVAHELREMPNDDPSMEMNVDELDIRRVEKEEALMLSDSIAKSYQFDSTTIKKVQTESHHVYRPPRREDKWYITQREWKKIWADYKVMRWERKQKKADQRKSKEESQEP